MDKRGERGSEGLGRSGKAKEGKRRGAAGGFWRRLGGLVGAMRNPEVPWTSKVFAIASFVYLVVPVDLIPDVIPFLGWSDDAGIVLAAVAKLAFDLRRIRERGKTLRVDDGE